MRTSSPKTTGRLRGELNVSDRMRAAVRMQREGASTDEIARVYGVARITVQGWIRTVREVERAALERETES
jgi:transposase